MAQISSYVIIKKEVEYTGISVYRAYFRGTNNRIKRSSGIDVPCYVRKTDLLFDLRNNPMERGVIV